MIIVKIHSVSFLVSFLAAVGDYLKKMGENKCDMVPFMLLISHLSVHFILCVDE